MLEGQNSQTQNDDHEDKYTVRHEVAYLSVRMVLWLLLWLYVGFIACANRKFRGTGWLLFRLLFLSLTLQFITDAILLGYDDAKEKEASDNRLDGIMGTHIFFESIAQSVFLMVMLLISSGFGITRKHLVGLHCQVFFLPFIYFLAKLMMDYTVFKFQGREFEDHGLAYDSDLEKAINFFTFIVFLFAMVLIWVYILDLAAKEIGFLTGEISELEDSGERGPRLGPQTTNQTNDVESGNTSSNNGNVQISSPNRSDPLETLNSQGIPQESTQREQPQELDQSVQIKVKLLVRFSRAGAVYVVWSAAKLLVPMFIHELAAFMEVSHNLVLWFVYIWLVILFRPRKDSPYLLLTEDDDCNEINHQDTRIEMGSVGAGQQVSQRAKFSLGEEEEETRN